MRKRLLIACAALACLLVPAATPAHAAKSSTLLRVRACDAFHAMTSDRPYRAAMPVVEAMEELRRCSGRQFDPAVVDALYAEAELDLAAG